jgi:hypothetical protein
MMERFAKADGPEKPERAAKVFLLSPEPDADVSEAVACVDKALTFEHVEARIGWFELSKGLAEHRAGRFASALDWLAKARRHCGDITFGDPRCPEATILAVTAMSHHHLGHVDEAQESLAEATQLSDGLPHPGVTDLGVGPENWAVLQVLLREARVLITPQAPASGAGATRPAAAR